jgi:hypothetical protein
MRRKDSFPKILQTRSATGRAFLLRISCGAGFRLMFFPHLPMKKQER